MVKLSPQAMLTTFQEVDMSGLIKMRKDGVPSVGSLDAGQNPTLGNSTKGDNKGINT